MKNCVFGKKWLFFACFLLNTQKYKAIIYLMAQNRACQTIKQPIQSQ